MKEIKEDKQMERYTMFVDWKNQYCQNDYTIESESESVSHSVMSGSLQPHGL